VIDTFRKKPYEHLLRLYLLPLSTGWFYDRNIRE